jgi:hypothetical protein
MDDDVLGGSGQNSKAMTYMRANATVQTTIIAACHVAGV